MKAKRPKHCQWIRGVCSETHSIWLYCHRRPKKKVCSNGHVVGWVCEECATDAAIRGFRTR